MDSAFSFFIGTTVLCALLMSITLVRLCVYLVGNEQKRHEHEVEQVSFGASEVPLAVFIRKLALLGPVLIVLASLAFGGVMYVIALAWQWSAQNAPWVFLGMVAAVAVWTSLDGASERRFTR